MEAHLERDVPRAIGLYQIAAAQGSVIAMNCLASLHLGHNGVTDVQSGMHWLQKAALAGDGDASYNLGMMFYHGHAVEKVTCLHFRYMNMISALAGALYHHIAVL